MHQKGFTLVEIAIVLVIVGLLLGGVLKGQELIVQARIKNIANDLNSIAAAIYGYQDRYRKLPGDDDQAASRWGIAATGNGDGVIGAGALKAFPDCAGSDKTAENCLLWQHLRRAGFIAGDAANASAPGHAGGGLMQVLAGALELPGLVICAANLPAKIANALDAQLDDGNAITGQIRATANPAALDKNGSDAAYAETANNSYTLCRTL